MTVLEFIFTLFSSYGELASFLGGFFGGEEFIIALSFLAAKGILPIWKIFLFSFLGIFLHDVFFYAIGRSRIFQNIQKFEKFIHLSKKYEHIIVKIDKKGVLNLLFTTKFIFGTRLLTLVYLGFKKKKIKEFLIGAFIIEFFWVSLFIFLGWFLGNSFYLFWDIFKNVPLAITTILLLIFFFIKFRKWMSNKILKKEGIAI